MATKIILHLGAHRTGTTSLQTALDEASQILQQSGIVALTPPRPGKRGLPTMRKLGNILVSAKGAAGFFSAPFKRREAAKLLGELLESQTGTSTLPERLILSDEKMLGRGFAADGQSIYPYARAHLASIRKVFPRKIDEIHLTIRSYDTFLVSVYAMRALYAHDVKPFDKIRENLLRLQLKWSDLVDALRQTFPGARIVLSVFEENDLPTRLHSLLGEEGRGVDIGQYLPPPVNKAPTLDAILAVQKSGRKPKEPDKVVEAYSGGKPFAPLDEETAKQLRAIYQAEVMALRERSGIEWLA